MRSPIRAVLPMALVSAMLLGLVPSVSATTTSDTSLATAISAAERDAFDLTNARRKAAGLVTFKADSRLFALARQRAAYMAETEEFSHTQSDGTTVFDLMSDRRITWYGAGEIIAWNTAADLDYSAAFAVQGWMNSPSHRAIVMSTGFNYVGFGLAISPTSGKRYWAGVYLKGPDRTGAWASIASVSTRRVDSVRSRVIVKLAGKDLRLQVLTSGWRYFQIQARPHGGTWKTYPVTTSTTFAKTWTHGHVYDIRVRSRDKAWNWGAWTYRTVKP